MGSACSTKLSVDEQQLVAQTNNAEDNLSSRCALSPLQNRLENHNIFISARFDGAEKERKARELHQALRSDEIGLKNVNMVDASAGEDFSNMTALGLYNMETMIAFSFEDYGQKTTNMSCSFYELRFAHNEGKNILPIKLCEEWPPAPQDHDGGRVSMAQNRMVFHPGLLYLDWSIKKWDALECAKQVKDAIKNRLSKKIERDTPIKSNMPTPSKQTFSVGFCLIMRQPVTPLSYLCGSTKSMSVLQTAKSLVKQSTLLSGSNTIVADGNSVSFMAQLKEMSPNIDILVLCAEGLSPIDQEHGDEHLVFQDSEMVKLLTDLKPKVLVLVMRYGPVSVAKRFENIEGISIIIPIRHSVFENNDEFFRVCSKTLIPAIEEFIEASKGTAASSAGHFRGRLVSMFDEKLGNSDAVRSLIGNEAFQPTFSSGEKTLQSLFGPRPSFLDWNARMNFDDSLRCLDLGLDDLSVIRYFEKKLRCTEATKRAVYFKPQNVDVGKDAYERARALAYYLCHVMSEDKEDDMRRNFKGIFRVQFKEDKEKVTSALKGVENGQALIWIDVHDEEIFGSGSEESITAWTRKFSNINSTFFLTRGLYSDEDSEDITIYTKKHMEKKGFQFDSDEQTFISGGACVSNQVCIVISLKGLVFHHSLYELESLRNIICREFFDLTTDQNIALSNVAIYNDDDDTIHFRLGVTNIKQLIYILNLVLFRNAQSRLQDSLKSGDFQDCENPHIDEICVMDILERAVLQVDSLNETQVEAINRWYDGHPGSLKIDGAAGTGKTFIALHCILSALERGKEEDFVLFATESEELCFHVARWLYVRVEKDSNSLWKAGKTLDRLLFHTSKYPEDKFILSISSSGKELKRKNRNAYNDKIVLYVVDEAHNIFVGTKSHFNKLVADFAKQIHDNDDSRLLLLSDESQAAARINWLFLKDIDTEILYTNCRSTRRLALASMLYQFRDCKNIDCTHNTVDGPMPKTYIFSKQDEKTVFITYSENILKALHHMIKDQFADNINIHLRIAIAVPDEHFRKRLLEANNGNLEQKLFDDIGCKISRAIDAVKMLPKRNHRDAIETRHIILDTVSALNGLEFIGVLAVGLDKEMGESDNAAERKLHQSMLYRAISRSRFTLAVINEYIENGWLTWIALSVMKVEKEVNFDSEKNRILPQIIKRQIDKKETNPTGIIDKISPTLRRNNNDTISEIKSHTDRAIIQQYFDITSNDVDSSRRNNPSFVPIELMANKASPLEFASEADHDDPIDGEGESSESVNSSRSTLERLIEAGDWAAVGATAAILASRNLRSNPGSLSSGSRASVRSDSTLDARRAAELDRLVDAGDWEGVVLSAAKYNAHDSRDGKVYGSVVGAKDSNRNVTDDGSFANFPANSPSVPKYISDAMSSSNLKRAEIRAEVESLVRQVVPEEIENIDEMMLQFRGREEELLETLRAMQERGIIAARQREATRGIVNGGTRIMLTEEEEAIAQAEIWSQIAEESNTGNGTTATVGASDAVDWAISRSLKQIHESTAAEQNQTESQSVASFVSSSNDDNSNM